MLAPRLRKTQLLFSIAAIVAIAACSQITEIAEKKSVQVISNADKIMMWWAGDYNNDDQIAALRKEGAPIWERGRKENEEGLTLGGHLPVTSYYRPVSMPAFGDRVLYLEEFTFAEDPYRQRIYTVIEDEETGDVRVKLWYFKDKTTYAGAWQDVDRLAALTPEDMSPLPDNCDLYVKEIEGGRLHMKMPENQCKFGTKIFDYQVSLSQDDFWFKDRIIDAEKNQVVVTAGDFTYHKLKRVKAY